MLYTVVLLYLAARVNNSSNMATANENVQLEDTPLSFKSEGRVSILPSKRLKIKEVRV